VVAAVTAWDMPQFHGALGWLPPSSSDEGALEDRARDDLSRVVEETVGAQPPVEVRTEVQYGTPASVLLRASRDASLLVVGSRGLGGFARYLPGRIGDHDIPAYVDEEGVSSERRTETFAEVELELESWRWAGTTFRLRSGKALKEDRMEVAVRFRTVPHLPFGHSGEALPNVLRFQLEPEGLTLDLTGIGSHAHELTPLSLTARMEPPDLPAYGRLLLDVLRGDPALSIRGDEAEEAWRVVEPVLSAWEKDLVPLEEYPAGSAGPPPREQLGDGLRRREDLLHEPAARPDDD
jgi:glucose-6-phosphate 1-dehydrogenase